VAAKYADLKGAEDNLVQKVLKGSAGVWGPVPMPPNAQVREADARTLVKWVLSQKGAAVPPDHVKTRTNDRRLRQAGTCVVPIIDRTRGCRSLETTTPSEEGGVVFGSLPMQKFLAARGGIEAPTPGFSIFCSTRAGDPGE
jgi:hypothetical protein